MSTKPMSDERLAEIEKLHMLGDWAIKELLDEGPARFAGASMSV
jgi:hypothetical protein